MVGVGSGRQKRLDDRAPAPFRSLEFIAAQVGRIRSHKISYVNSFTTCDDSTLPFALASRKSLDALSSILNEDEYAFHLEIDAKGTISVAVP